MKNSKSMIPPENIAPMIYVIRHKVMIDHDLAELYGVPTNVFNQAVSRNKDRFPEDFMSQLNKEEWDFFKVTNCDLKT